MITKMNRLTARVIRSLYTAFGENPPTETVVSGCIVMGILMAQKYPELAGNIIDEIEMSREEGFNFIKAGTKMMESLKEALEGE